MANRLENESSPYLRQHAHNPVDWYPWGAEAIERSRSEQRPIFLSIGYSACHWCHVMEHESFENPEIARMLNDHFVSIKVDREERPDLDQIYMTAVQILSGRGGWPMSMFLTPDLQPFYGGTYWPPFASRGMPGFNQVLMAVIDAWQNRREMVEQQASGLTERIGTVGLHDRGEAELDDELLWNAARYFERSFDSTYGGFGGAPKFPHAMDLQLLLRLDQRQPRSAWKQMVQVTLDRMAAGGIYDHLGGGFARYSVDERWLVPHFEKMLYDNGLLASAYIDSYLATGNLHHATVARETLDYVLRDMQDEAGGFHSAEDADSEGEEGLFYVWTIDELQGILGEETGGRFAEVYGASEHGNFEGRNILHLARSLEQTAQLRGWPGDELRAEMSAAKAKLLEVRGRRIRPAKDDKVLTGWNALMIDALARAARAFDEPRYLEAATRAAEFFHQKMWRDGRLLHSWRNGHAHLAAYLDDYSGMANALISLFEAGQEARWLAWSVELLDVVLARFRDPDGGALFYTADDHEKLITRSKDLQDSSVPSGNSLAATALARLSHLTGEARYREAALEIVQSAGGLLEQAPAAAGQMLIAADYLLGPVAEIVVVSPSDDTKHHQALREVHRRFLPRSVLVAHTSDDETATTTKSGSLVAHLIQNRTPVDGHPTYYVCVESTCAAPIVASQATPEFWEKAVKPV